MTCIVTERPLAGSKGSAGHSLKPPRKLATDFQSTPRRETLEPFWYSSASVVTKAGFFSALCGYPLILKMPEIEFFGLSF